MRTKIPYSILVHDLLAIEIKFIRELDNPIDFGWQINHGPEWHMEFSIPIQTPYRHFSNF